MDQLRLLSLMLLAKSLNVHELEMISSEKRSDSSFPHTTGCAGCLPTLSSQSSSVAWRGVDEVNWDEQGNVPGSAEIDLQSEENQPVSVWMKIPPRSRG